jgi:EAL domain-containing protein (putative c-di-GMP-specific phosphodiesterase class I)
MVPRSEFIPVADETGLILTMNRSLMIGACKQLRESQHQFPSESPLTMSVNIAPKQFIQPDLGRDQLCPGANRNRS